MVRPLESLDIFVERYFSAVEQTAWHSLPDSERLRAFYFGWTRKEAYLQARGVGIVQPLAAFDVSLELDGENLLLIDRVDPGACAQLRIVNLPMDRQRVAALAAASEEPLTVQQFTLQAGE